VLWADVTQGTATTVNWILPVAHGTIGAGPWRGMQVQDYSGAWLDPVAVTSNGTDILLATYVPVAGIDSSAAWQTMVQPTGFAAAGAVFVPQSGFMD
jgi:hypothetical protein